MAQLFHPATNTLAKASIFGSVFIICGLTWVTAEVYRSPYFTDVNVIRDQPVPFSHQHHVAGLGIHCLYCHTSVEKSSSAGMPSTHTCMTCHSQIWTNAAMLEPVRQSWKNSTPLKWTRVHDVPQYVYFNHSIHVSKGIGCTTCHGQVSEMPLMWKNATLFMRWCLDCHNEPEKFIRPRERVFDTDYEQPDDQLALGAKLVREYHVAKGQLSNCSVCHR
ncbi:MAG: cytochrome c3 family protein [Tepidisphaeraceae bacterium]